MKGCDSINKLTLLKYKSEPIISMMKHYAIALTLSLGTSVVGFLFIHNLKNVVERVELFPDGTSDFLGTAMIILCIIKVFTVFKKGSKLKKYALIGITLCWITITWAYAVNQTQNAGLAMSAMITIICYLELWRGDYSD